MTKFAARPPSLSLLPATLEKAYRTAYFGRPGATYIDLPADYIQGTVDSSEIAPLVEASSAPRFTADNATIKKAAALIKSATSPLVVIGKGAAYSQSEAAIRELIKSTSLPFLPTPMGKGVVPDSSSSNFAAARSAVLKDADVILLLGGRLNWILHYGEAPKFRENVKIIQVDIASEEIGNNNANNIEYGLVGDIDLTIRHLLVELKGYRFSSIPQALIASRDKNTAAGIKKADNAVLPMTYQHSYKIIKEAIAETNTKPIFISEGANTMDTARSAFDVEEPRRRMDAGTMATMGVGIGYAIAGRSSVFSLMSTVYILTLSYFVSCRSSP